MGGLENLGKALLVIGIVTASIGGLLMLGGGRLPGDIIIEKKNFTFYFPLAASIILSIILTLIFWLLGKR